MSKELSNGSGERKDNGEYFWKRAGWEGTGVERERKILGVSVINSISNLYFHHINLTVLTFSIFIFIVIF